MEQTSIYTQSTNTQHWTDELSLVKKPVDFKT